MERRNNYPIEIKTKVDLNTDMLLTELLNLLKKDRAKILRLIIADFFDKNMDIIDEHISSKIDKDLLTESILKDFLDINKATINEYRKIQNEKK